MSSYYERQKSLFNTLKEAEEQYGFAKCNETIEPQECVIDKRTYRKQKYVMKQFRGKESIFKRSEAKIQQCLRRRSKPEFIKNPHKWDYYTLSDVTPEQMSEATNTATALAFIKEMEEREAENKQMTVTDETGAVFKKPIFQISKTIKKNSQDEEKIIFKSSKVIMPEYVVGVSQKKKDKKAAKLLKVKDNAIDEELEKKSELKLNHLYDDNEEDNENE
ncbi:unnamed protein product [Leptidea sinapis]|uniref:Uncharacterized protein n=1 Tax=Leptidea sinapis TaxID=189913 RepID=A0A5E4R1M4_9NEOP|nr:unnamed protein product [Leptidea sinapis]